MTRFSSLTLISFGLAVSSCATVPRETAQTASNPPAEIQRTPADTGKNCVAQNSRNCLIMPGLAEGQIVRLRKDLPLDNQNGWLYFVGGTQIAAPDLIKNIGQTYCGITATDKSASAQSHRIQKGRYELKEISWYVNTVFFTSGKNGFVAFCSTVDEHFTNPGVTSSAAIAKDLKGVVE